MTYQRLSFGYDIMAGNNGAQGWRGLPSRYTDEESAEQVDRALAVPRESSPPEPGVVPGGLSAPDQKPLPQGDALVEKGTWGFKPPWGEWQDYPAHIADKPQGHKTAWLISKHLSPGMGIILGCDAGDFTLGFGNSHSIRAAHWPNGEPITDIWILGQDAHGHQGDLRALSHGTIDLPTISLSMGHGLGGWDRIGFAGVKFQPAPGAPSGLLTNVLNPGGSITAYGCQIARADTQDYAGRGIKWGMRLNSDWHEMDFRAINVIDAPQEHGFYIDSVRDSYMADITVRGAGRTGIYTVHRGEHGKPRIMGGDFLLERCEVLDSDKSAGGGSDFTFVGHLGKIHLRDCESFNSASGSFTSWTDEGHGAYLNRDGYSTDRIILDNFTARTDRADRTAIMCSGARRVDVHEFRVSTNKGAFDGLIDGARSRYGGPIGNGIVRWNQTVRTTSRNLVQHPGFEKWGNGMLGYYDFEGDPDGHKTRWMSEREIGHAERLVGGRG